MKNEVMDNMEYLMQELHREWARSGPSCISCTLQSTEAVSYTHLDVYKRQLWKRGKAEGADPGSRTV